MRVQLATPGLPRKKGNLSVPLNGTVSVLQDRAYPAIGESVDVAVAVLF